MMSSTYTTFAAAAFTLALASSCTAIFDPDRVTYTGDDAGYDGGPAVDAGMDAGRHDAGTGSDTGISDAGFDAGPTCAADPNPMGEGTCTATDDCLAHCSPNWDVACFFGPYGRATGEGVCIYRDCRLMDIDINFEPDVCPMFGNCPNRFCERDRAVVTCCPPPGCNSSCSY